MHFVLPFYGHHQKRIKILLRRHAGGVDVKTEGGFFSRVIVQAC